MLFGCVLLFSLMLYLEFMNFGGELDNFVLKLPNLREEIPKKNFNMKCLPLTVPDKPLTPLTLPNLPRLSN